MELPNPPSEREWTDEEKESFFASQDAMTLNFNDIPKQPPIGWSTGAWNGPLIELDPDDPFGDMERIFRRGVHVTSITPPESGWPMAIHCPLCRQTTFFLSPYAVKPTEDGKEFDGYHLIRNMCGNAEHAWEHNMKMGMKGWNEPIDLKPDSVFRWK